jgi:hypothetical protein
MSEPGREPQPSRENSLVWALVITVTAAVLVSLALPLAQGLEASAAAIAHHPAD